ncbi:MAG: DUF1302 family protein [Gammaproteobacteria bacterium]|nr:DUF1302 family protein [Gammaproteobacteria bacterium]
MSAFAATSDIDIALPDDLDALIKESVPSKYLFSGYLKNETAYRFDEPRSFTKIRNTFSLNYQYMFNRRVKFYTSGWMYYDPVYELFDYNTIVARDVRDKANPLAFLAQLDKEKDDKGYDLREFYFDLYLENLDLRIGKQFVVWGVIEGIRVVDEINPMNFRELIIPELLDYRIPLWTFKADYYGEKTSYEFLWIPDLKFHKPAPAGSEWELFQVLPSTTKPESFNPKYSEVGFKITREMFDASFSFSYFYTWDDYPTTFRVISARDVQTNSQQDLAIYPTYMRMHMFGATMTKEVRGDIVKAEFAYVKDKYFAIVDDYEQGYLKSDGDFKRDHIRWGLGYDFSFWGADISPSINQSIILNYSSAILDDEFDTTFNLFLRKPIQSHSAIFTLLFIRLINFQETYVKPRMTFNLTDHFQVIVGADFFIGRRTAFGRQRAEDPNVPGGLIDPEQTAQFLGNFNENKRVSVDFKYNF